MTANKIVLIIPLLLIGLLPVAHAEELTVIVENYSEDHIVSVPFQISGKFCKASYDGFIPIMMCVFRGMAPDGTPAVWDNVKETWTSEKILEQEAKEDHEKWLEENYPEPPKTKWEEAADRIPENPKGSTDIEAEKQINKILEEDFKCLQGTGQTAGMQKFRGITAPWIEMAVHELDENGELVPTGEIRKVLDKSALPDGVSLRGILGELESNKRECQAQQILDNPQGGVTSSYDAIFAYLDREPTPNHRDTAKGISPITQDRANAMANEGTKNTPLYDLICSGYWSDTHKRDYGCYDTDYSEPESTVIEHSDNPARMAYEQYLLDDGEAQKAKIIEHKRAIDYWKYR